MEHREEMIREARIIALAAPVLMPLLEKRKKVAYERLLMEFRSGSSNYHHLVSELSVLSMLIRDVEEKEQIIQTLGSKK
jgi:hypothetical protein